MRHVEKILLPLLLLLAGCDSNANLKQQANKASAPEPTAAQTNRNGSASSTDSSSADSLSQCVQTGARAPLPQNFPSDFPLPPGAFVNSSRRSETGVMVISGYVPLSLKETVSFFNERLPQAGFHLGRSEVETVDAEAGFSSENFNGQFRVSSLPNCAGAVKFMVALSPLKTNENR